MTRVALLTFLLLPAPAFAQSRFELSAGVTRTGGFDAGAKDPELTRNPGALTTPLTLFDVNARVETAFGAVARATLFVTSHLAVEGLAEYSRPVLRATFSSDFEGATGNEARSTLTSLLFGGSLLYHFGGRRVTPFVSGGVAWERQLDEARVMLVTGAEVHAGGGVRYALTRHVGLRAEGGVSSRERSIAFAAARRVLPVVSMGLGYRF